MTAMTTIATTSSVLLKAAEECFVPRRVTERAGRFYGVFGNRRALPVEEIQVVPFGAKMSVFVVPPVGP